MKKIAVFDAKKYDETSFKPYLDKKVDKLIKSGYSSLPYKD